MTDDVEHRGQCSFWMSILCKHGIAFISFIAHDILVAGSLEDSNFWNMPRRVRLDADNIRFEYVEKPMNDVVAVVDLISNNAILLRLFCRDDVCGTEENFIQFRITQDELKRVALECLSSVNL